MTKDQLKVLGQLPAVLEALRALVADADELRALVARAAGVGLLPETMPVPGSHLRDGTRNHPERRFPELAGTTGTVPPVAPGHASLATPERQEYEAAMRTGAPIDVPLEEMTPGQRARADRAAFLGRVAGDGTRSAKLSQFQRTPGPVEESVTAVPLETLSEAT